MIGPLLVGLGVGLTLPQVLVEQPWQAGFAAGVVSLLVGLLLICDGETTV